MGIRDGAANGLRTRLENVGVRAELAFAIGQAAYLPQRKRPAWVVETKLFSAFKAHYRSSARYCNPEKRNEKGNVENAVGFLRRNFMVPVPAAASSLICRLLPQASVRGPQRDSETAKRSYATTAKRRVLAQIS